MGAGLPAMTVRASPLAIKSHTDRVQARSHRMTLIAGRPAPTVHFQKVYCAFSHAVRPGSFTRVV